TSRVYSGVRSERTVYSSPPIITLTEFFLALTGHHRCRSPHPAHAPALRGTRAAPSSPAGVPAWPPPAGAARDSPLPSPPSGSGARDRDARWSAQARRSAPPPGPSRPPAHDGPPPPT